MYARSTTFRARPDSIDEGITFCRDEVLPMIRNISGCLGLSMIVDRESGRCIATSSWQTQEAMRASDAQLQPVRERAAEIFGGSPEVEEWEIALLHRDHRAAEGACLRATWLRFDAADVDRALDVFKHGVLPRIEELDGFCSASLLVNRDSGRAVGNVSFDSREAMERSRDQAAAIRSKGSQETNAEIEEVCEFELALAHLDVPELV